MSSSYRDTKPVELDGRYEGGTSGFDIHEFGILLARKFHEVFLGNKNLTRDLGNIKELGMFVEKYFYGTREESLPFYRLFCITWCLLILSDNLYGSRDYWVSLQDREISYGFSFLPNIRSSASKHPCHAPVFLAVYPPGFWVLGLKGLWGSVFPDPLSLRSCPLGALPIIPLCLSREEAKKQKNK